MEKKLKSYEAMFLMDSGGGDFTAVSSPVKEMLDKYKAEILALKPWDDRKLAYEIKKRKRGYYILAYFMMDPLMVRELEHDCKLDERFLRMLVLKKDAITQEMIAADTPATGAKIPDTIAPTGDEETPDVPSVDAIEEDA